MDGILQWNAHDCADWASPMQTASSASCTCSEFLSAVEYTATHGMPISCAVRITLTAISPRFATRIFSSLAARTAKFRPRLGALEAPGEATLRLRTEGVKEEAAEDTWRALTGPSREVERAVWTHGAACIAN